MEMENSIVLTQYSCFFLFLFHVTLNLSELLFIFNHIEPIMVNYKFKSFESTGGGYFTSLKTPQTYQWKKARAFGLWVRVLGLGFALGFSGPKPGLFWAAQPYLRQVFFPLFRPPITLSVFLYENFFLLVLVRIFWFPQAPKCWYYS